MDVIEPPERIYIGKPDGCHYIAIGRAGSQVVSTYTTTNRQTQNHYDNSRLFGWSGGYICYIMKEVLTAEYMCPVVG